MGGLCRWTEKRLDSGGTISSARSSSPRRLGCANTLPSAETGGRLQHGSLLAFTQALDCP